MTGIRRIVDRHGGWLWVVCAGGCGHQVPVAYVPFVIRWGEDDWRARLHRTAHCTRCGHRGATFRLPSHTGAADRGIHPFPIDYLIESKSIKKMPQTI